MSPAPAHQRASNRSAPTVTANSSANTGSSANRIPIRADGSARWAVTWSSGAITEPASAR